MTKILQKWEIPFRLSKRVDDIGDDRTITDSILEQIRKSEFLIADLSFERPNVYYEVGYAHALNKRPILFKSRGTRVHFDLSVHNVREYSNMTELAIKLKKLLGYLLDRNVSEE